MGGWPPEEAGSHVLRLPAEASVKLVIGLITTHVRVKLCTERGGDSRGVVVQCGLGGSGVG